MSAALPFDDSTHAQPWPLPRHENLHPVFAGILQAIEEAAKMRADLATATTLADLDQLYQAWIGYSVVADDPSATFESVRAILDGYVDEFVDACRQEVLA